MGASLPLCTLYLGHHSGSKQNPGTSFPAHLVLWVPSGSQRTVLLPFKCGKRLSEAAGLGSQHKGSPPFCLCAHLRNSSLCPLPLISLSQVFCNNSSAGLRTWEVPFCHFMSVKSGQGSSELNFHSPLKIPTSLSWGCSPEPPRCCCQLNVSRSKN